MDGINCLSTSFLVCLINILWDPNIFKLIANHLCVQQAMPWAIVFARKTIHNVDAL